MKKWEMPLINVDRFSANDYIAACRQFANVSGNMYWDVFEREDFLFIFHYYNFNENGDGRYDSSYEDITSGTNGVFSVNGDVPTGWHTQTLWTNGRYPSNRASYASSSGFNNIGTYKVYVFASGQAWIYGSDMDTSKTPTVAKNFS